MTNNDNNIKMQKLKNITRMYEKTFKWDCHDMAEALYANAVYAIVTENKAFNTSVKEFMDYMHENKIY